MVFSTHVTAYHGMCRKRASKSIKTEQMQSCSFPTPEIDNVLGLCCDHVLMCTDTNSSPAAHIKLPLTLILLQLIQCFTSANISFRLKKTAIRQLKRQLTKTANIHFKQRALLTSQVTEEILMEMER